MPTGTIYEHQNFKLEVIRAGSDTNGALLEVTATYGPASKFPPAHYHPEQQETFEVRQGAMRFIVDGSPG